MLSVIRILLARERKSTADGRDPGSRPLIFAACSEHNCNVIDILLQNGANLRSKDLNNFTAFSLAARAKCYDNALYLLGLEDPHYVGEELARDLFYLTSWDLCEFSPMIVEALAERFNAHGRFDVLQRALYLSRPHYPDDRKEAAKFLANFLAALLSRAYLQEGQGYLHWLFQKRRGACTVHLKTLKFVLQEARDNLDINSADAEGYTPLDYAVSYGHEEAAAILKEHGGRAGERATKNQGSGAIHELPEHLTIMSL
ncbi:ankyrin repeat-containing domain protein [Hypoxylon sp. FL0890]|nr:ankyrin repeat-containing domain protein [Hypoxylon sp. FL0890]